MTDSGAVSSPTPIDVFLDRMRELDIRLWIDGEHLRCSAPTGALSAELREELRARRDEIRAALGAASRNGRSSEAVDAGAGTAPLSPAQERIWFFSELEPESAAYNMSVVLTLEGALDIGTLERSVDAVVARHGMLRTTFTQHDGVPRQTVHPATPLRLSVDDVSAQPADHRQRTAEAIWKREAERPFNLATEYPLRVALVRLGEHEHHAVITLHHIAADGASLVILIRELVEHYSALRSNHAARVPELRVQYADHARTQNRWLASPAAAPSLKYWTDLFSGELPVLDLPTDNLRPAVQTFRGGALAVTIPPETTAALRALSRRHGCTLFMTMLAAFNALLYRHTGDEDIIVGSPMAGRDHAETKDLIGLFINTLAFRTDLSGNPTFEELLGRVRATALQGFAHQEIPFARLLESLRLRRDSSRTPLFQVLFNMFSLEVNDHLEVDGLRFAPPPMERLLAAYDSESKFDLTLYAHDRPDGMHLTTVYNTDLFSDARIEALQRRFVRLLDVVARAPESRIGDIALEPGASSARPVSHALRPGVFERVQPDFVDASIPQRFREIVTRQPDHPAIVAGGEQWTYAQLNAYATRIAELVQAAARGAGTRVGLLCDHDAPMIGTILGVLSQGSAYVPLDPAFPEDRLAMFLDNAGVTMLVAAPQHATLAARLAKGERVVVSTDAEGPRSPVDVGAVGADTTAYVLYTSGSSGQPKGIWQNHSNVLHYVRAYANRLELTSSDRLTLVASYTFDASIVDVFSALLRGATIYPVQLRVAGLDGIANLIRDQRITIYHSTPTLYRALAAYIDRDAAAAARAVVLGGEKVHPQDYTIFCERFPGGSVFVNLYGASEVTIASMELLDHQSATRGSVSIGPPVEATEMTLVDAEGRPSPVKGEIAVTSRHLALGYWNAADLTARSFSAIPGDARRMYRTGDLARRAPDGVLEFLGRKDHQVKILGVRVEPGEVETALAKHPRVAQAAVNVDRAANGDPFLIGFVVLRAPGSVSVADLKEFLRQSVPEYMVPAGLVILDSLPLTRTGKIDRRALPSGRELGFDRTEYVGPRNAIEQMIADVWREVLNVETIGVRDNFFALGGNSLNATQVIARLRIVAQLNLPLRSLFSSPTVEGLARAFSEANATNREFVPALQPHAAQGPSTLSFAQERMWFLQQIAPEGTAYNMLAPVELRGTLDRAAFVASLEDVAQRQNMLRTVFPAPEGDAVQVVLPTISVPIIERDVSHLPASERRAAAEQMAIELVAKPFALDAAPPWWTLLIRLDDDHHVCAFCLHHILGDLWSLGVFAGELFRFYNARVTGTPAALQPLTVQYSDFAVWQREWLQGEPLESQLGYWKPRLAGVTPLELPTDRPRPPMQTTNGGRAFLEIPAPLVERIRALSVREGVTPFMTVFAAFNAALHRYTGQEDITVGVPIANRTEVGVETLIGTFVNTLVHRNDLSGNPQFRELLGRIRAVALDAYAHQDLPFERLVRDVAPDRDPSRTPVFQVLFNMANTPMRTLEIEGLSIDLFEVGRGAAQFDLTLNVRLAEQSSLAATFNTDLFDRDTIVRFLTGYLAILDAVARTPEQNIGALPVMSDADRRTLLVERNATNAEYPRESVTTLVAAQAARTPKAVAVEFGNVTLSYAELDERSNRLAHYLRRRGVAPGALVGVCVNRSAEMVIALLGVLKAGAAYVPIDPTYPAHRIQFMLEDSGAGTLITEKALLRRLPESNATIVVLDRDSGEISGESAAALESSPSHGDRAYVIYTSGSTGNPKGVEIPHGALVNFLWSMRQTPGMTEQDSLLAVTTISFDIAGLELYLPLVCGATIVLASTDVAADGRRLRELIERRSPTVMQATPATWRGLIDAGWQGNPTGLKILCGGEAMPRELADGLLQRAAEVWNVYGPTETTIWSTLHRVTRGSDNIPIGTPLANTRVYVLDKHRQPVPVGVHGELYIAGDGVALGYLNRPELTAERFVADPFAADGTRMYRTGDRAKFRRDGTLEHLGRLDHQVKVRGYRIELGEIEAALDRLPATNQSVVDVKQDRLVAYVVFEPDQNLTASEIRAALRDTLPDYMVPSLVVPMERLPLTPNGKVDRRALPDPLRSGGRREATFQPPTSPIEIAIADVWKETLGVERVSTNDNFFELGGHSLLSIRVVHEIHLRTGWRPDPRLFFFENLGKIAAAKPDSAAG